MVQLLLLLCRLLLLGTFVKNSATQQSTVQKSTRQHSLAQHSLAHSPAQPRTAAQQSIACSRKHMTLNDGRKYPQARTPEDDQGTPHSTMMRANTTMTQYCGGITQTAGSALRASNAPNSSPLNAASSRTDGGADSDEVIEGGSDVQQRKQAAAVIIKKKYSHWRPQQRLQYTRMTQ